jgi:hypothetical protein
VTLYSAGGSGSDWRTLQPTVGFSAGVRDNTLEYLLPLSPSSENWRMLVGAKDSAGNLVIADAPSGNNPALLAEVTLSSSQTPMLKLTARGGTVTLTSVSFVSSCISVTLPITLAANEEKVIQLNVDTAKAPASGVVDPSIVAMNAGNAVVVIKNDAEHFYASAPPTQVQIDGVTADWNSSPGTTNYDAVGDVARPGVDIIMVKRTSAAADNMEAFLVRFAGSEIGRAHV